MSISVGIDLGRLRDHTAIAAIERMRDGRTVVRFVERVKLGTPWSVVVERVRRIVTDERMAGRCAVAVDATGVGSPVVEMLQKAGLGCEIVPVTITSGERESQTAQGWSVPKKDLMTGLQLGLEDGSLVIARRMKEVGALARELVDVKAKGARIGAEGAGQHDDLVIAVALAVWKAKQRKKANLFGTQRLV